MDLYHFHPWLSSLMLPFSHIYGAFSARRTRSVLGCPRSVRKLGLPVVSVGNITVGGTGKTPTTMYMAARLLEFGRRPVVLSRGYGGRPRRGLGGISVVSDGSRVFLYAREAGDEPRLLAERLPGVPVLCCRDRHAAGVWAEARGMGDVFVLDDGYQHVRLHRDFNLLVVDALDPVGNGRLVPAGPLREPVDAARRASAILLTRRVSSIPDSAEVGKLTSAAPSVPVFTSSFSCAGLRDVHSGALVRPEELEGLGVLAACGVGRPEMFFRSLESSGPIRIADRLVFPDHEPFSQRACEKIRNRCRGLKAGAVVVTEKDAVKLRGFRPGPPLFALVMDLVPDDGPGFWAAVLSSLGTRPPGDHLAPGGDCP